MGRDHDEQLRGHVTRLFPGATIEAIEPLATDGGIMKGATEKVAGYGEVTRIVLVDAASRVHDLVWHAVGANEYGHDRRADRVAEALEAFDDSIATPGHVRAVDVGMIGADGVLHSLRDVGEPYLITEYARGTVYASDLRRIAGERTTRPGDVERLETLARYLVALHVTIPDGVVRYRRALRDLVGSGEGIFGIIDGYPTHVSSVSLQMIEEACTKWRWRLHDRHDRLTRTHGDFHPFNILFDGVTPRFLDASRGACGDPADDVAALAINFLAFAIDDPAAWPHGLGVLWRHWWTSYLSQRDDPELLSVIPPFLAWRTLVVCNPHFYPKLSDQGRAKLLGFIEDMLANQALDPMAADDLFPRS